MAVSVKYLEVILAEKNMSKSELARKCGWSRERIGQIAQRGVCHPKTAKKLADMLGVSVAALAVPNQSENPYWERICAMSCKQRKKGLETYGQGIEANPAAMLKRIEHLQEELIDGLMYCEWIKDKLMELEGEKHDQD